MQTTTGKNAIGWLAPLLPARDDGARDGNALAGLIERVRRRWRLRLLLDGLFRALALATVTILLGAWLLQHWHFSPTALWLLRSTAALCLLLIAWHFCLRPLRRQVDDGRVALYLEEHEPGLKSILLGAVDASRQDQHNLSRARRLRANRIR